MLVVLAYVFCIPLVAMHLPGVGGVGAADLLMPLGFVSLLLLRRVAPVRLSHVALAAFMIAALLSLSMIDEKRIALDCTVRWVRLASIVVTFYFGLFMPVSGRQLNRVFVAYGIAGLLAIAIGVLLYQLQIEIRDSQQKLWIDGGFQVRAGGLIGNSGAFGHLAATWCVTCIGALCILGRSRYRFVLAAAVLMVTLYTVYIASSRATMFHLVTALTAFALLVRMPLAWRKQLLTLALVGGLALTLLVCLSQVMARPSAETSNVVASNLERFIPGWNGGDISEFTSSRTDNWPEYVAMMSKSWLIGTGYKTGVRMHEDSPDNSYLSVMLETGMLGFSCMSLFVISVLHRLATLYLRGDQYAAVMIPVCIGQLTHCLTSDIYTFWITMPVVYLLLGFVIQRQPEQKGA
jgi:O-antigen ligase